MLTGTLFALAAGLMWGLVFIAPLLLPEYPAALQSFGRYLAFGLIALPLAWLDRARLALLTRADWVEAMKLAAVGNIVYYLFLASSIQRAGAPLPTMIIGTLPVVIAISSNLRDARRDGKLPWLRLLPSLALIGAGIALVNHVEIGHLRADAQADLGRYALGALLAVGAVACWTWYPLRNADWLRAHADRPPGTWATAQGIATLPLALVGYLAWWAWSAVSGDGFPMPLGPRPARVRGADVCRRLARLVARHAVLERSQPTPADHAGGAADRVRDPVGAGLCLHAARPRARAADPGRHRLARGRRAVGAARAAGARGGARRLNGGVWRVRVRICQTPLPA